MAKETKTDLIALSRLFSSTVFQDLAKKGRSAMFLRLADQSRILPVHLSDFTVADVFNRAFQTLKVAGHRDEYIYRSAITHKILMGTHSLRTASMLSEFRAGSSKADLVILNGTATVYEIKSERDTLSRLATQVADYQKVFAKVNVITSEEHVAGVLATVSEEVGVLSLSKRHQITTEREAAESIDGLHPLTILSSLRASEATAILMSMGVDVPTVPNTQLHSLLRTKFAKLDSAVLHQEMVKTLKRTRKLTPLSELVDQLPESLQAAALSIPIRRSDHARLVDAVRTPLSTAMAWS